MSRYAVKISKEELFEKIFSALKKHEEFEQEEWDEAMEWTREYEKEITEQNFLLKKLSQFGFQLFDLGLIGKDLNKVSFDAENFSCFNDKDGDVFGYKLGGLQTLDNGLTFLGCAVGGDWEQPVFFIIYWDGESLRGYIPKEGNLWNKTTKQAYGNDEEEDLCDLLKQYKKRKDCVAEVYQNIEDTGDYEDSFDLILDDKLIEEDIKKRIIIK